MSFPNIETALIAALPAALGTTAGHVGAETPHDLAARLPFYKVARVGGSDRDHRLDVALISVDAYGPDLATARDGCEAVRTWLLGVSSVGDCVVTLTQTVAAPSRRPYDNTSLRRYGATFRITFH